MRILTIVVIVARLGLGGLFIYGGVKKFIPKPPRPTTETSVEVPDHVLKIRAYIGGLKQTEFFWPMLGVAEILCGVLLVSQYLALLGAVMLVPITVNIFCFHLFLEPHDTGELILTGFYLLVNAGLIAASAPKLKKAFLNFELI